MPKRLAVVASAIALVLAPTALVACGGDDSGSSSTKKAGGRRQQPRSSRRASTLTLWTMPNSPKPKEDLQKMVEPFTAKTGVKVDVQEVGWDVQFDRIRNAAVSGEGPDITQAGTTQVPFFAALGGFSDLSDRVDDIGGKGAYADGHLEHDPGRGPGRHVGDPVVHRGALDLLPQGRAREGRRRSRRRRSRTSTPSRPRCRRSRTRCRTSSRSARPARRPTTSCTRSCRSCGTTAAPSSPATRRSRPSTRPRRSRASSSWAA